MLDADADAMDIFMMAVKLGRLKLVKHLQNDGVLKEMMSGNELKLLLFSSGTLKGPLYTSSYAHSYMVYSFFHPLRMINELEFHDDFDYCLKLLMINAYEHGITDTVKVIYNELLFTYDSGSTTCRKLTLIDAYFETKFDTVEAKHHFILALLEAGVDVNVLYEHGDNALHLFCKVKYFDENIVRTLIRAGIDVNHTNTDGMTPLFYAVCHIKDEDLSASEETLVRCVSIFMEMAPTSIDYLSITEYSTSQKFAGGAVTRRGWCGKSPLLHKIYGMALSLLSVLLYRKCTKVVKMLLDGGFIQHLSLVLDDDIHTTCYRKEKRKECRSILLFLMDDSLLSSTIEEYQNPNKSVKTLNALRDEKKARQEIKNAAVEERNTVVCDQVREQALLDLLAGEPTSKEKVSRKGVFRKGSKI